MRPWARMHPALVTAPHWEISHPADQNTLTAVRDDADRAVAETDGGEGARYVFVRRAANATGVPRLDLPLKRTCCLSGHSGQCDSVQQRTSCDGSSPHTRSKLREKQWQRR